MSTATFDQLREEVLRFPPPIKLALTTALMLEKEQQQKLLDELAQQKPIERREVKVRRGVAQDFSRETHGYARTRTFTQNSIWR